MYCTSKILFSKIEQFLIGCILISYFIVCVLQQADVIEQLHLEKTDFQGYASVMANYSAGTLNNMSGMPSGSNPVTLRK